MIPMPGEVVRTASDGQQAIDRIAFNLPIPTPSTGMALSCHVRVHLRVIHESINGHVESESVVSSGEGCPRLLI